VSTSQLAPSLTITIIFRDVRRTLNIAIVSITMYPYEWFICLQSELVFESQRMGISKKLICLIHFYYYVCRYKNCQSFGTELLKILKKNIIKDIFSFIFCPSRLLSKISQVQLMSWPNTFYDCHQLWNILWWVCSLCAGEDIQIPESMNCCPGNNGSIGQNAGHKLSSHQIQWPLANCV